MPLVVASEIAKTYGMRPVLRGVSLGVDRGEFVAVLGANGAGKTTFLRILSTLSRPDSGRLHLGGVDAVEHPARARAIVGYVSHQPLLYPDLTAAENLWFYAQLYGVAGGNRGETQGRIDAALRKANLSARAGEPTKAFSRGMLQRLAIARALLHDPGVVLLDEPYTGLDQVSARGLSELLLELAGAGRALIMTTHDISRGLDGVTRAVMIRGGKMAAELPGPVTPDRVAQLFEKQ